MKNALKLRCFKGNSWKLPGIWTPQRAANLFPQLTVFSRTFWHDRMAEMRPESYWLQLLFCRMHLQNPLFSNLTIHSSQSSPVVPKNDTFNYMAIVKKKEKSFHSFKKKLWFVFCTCYFDFDFESISLGSWIGFPIEVHSVSCRNLVAWCRWTTKSSPNSSWARGSSVEYVEVVVVASVVGFQWKLFKF